MALEIKDRKFFVPSLGELSYRTSNEIFGTLVFILDEIVGF